MGQNESRRLKISGRLGLKARMNLLQSSLAVWPRRGKSLLEVNCGDGHFLSMLWECGFDVTATEHDVWLRDRALEHAGFRAEVVAAADDHLPFEGDAFDWVILHAAASDLKAFENSLDEALRVAAGGIAVTFWNSASLPYMLHRFGRGKFWPWPTYNCFGVWRKLKKYSMGRLTLLSTLSGPVNIWNRRYAGILRQACGHVMPLGAWCIIRMNIAPSGFVRPLPLRLDNTRFVSPEPLLECRRANNVIRNNKSNCPNSK
ncbi:MAG: class I SAM-dependent methyltransferase [Desulfovibrio sp.]|jgi:hypothetical protein|nr:class I SAM-dependent methyltransferase [Desulfovibrio sp.]